MTVFLLLFIGPLTMFIFETKFNSGIFLAANMENSTIGYIKGGFLYMFLQYFSWGLYTDWLPKSIMTFHNYYLGNVYGVCMFLLYSILLLFIIKCRSLFKNALPYLGIFFAAIFFAKGTQAPWGGIIDYLLKHFSFFGMVRSPDNKFGIGAVFAVAVLIMLVLQHYRDSKVYKVLKYYFLSSIIIFSISLLSGEVILAKDDFPKSGRLVTTISSEYKEVLNIFNSDPTLNNVLIYPSLSGNFNYNNHLFIGRDVLKTQTTKPFLYNSFAKTTNKNLSRYLSSISENLDFKNLKLLNIKYILVRRDELGFNSFRAKTFIEELEKSNIAKKLIENDFLILFQVNDEWYAPRLNLTNGDSYLKYVSMSPVKYKISIKNVHRAVGLNFLESFNKYFKLYLRPTSRGLLCQPVRSSEVECPQQRKFFESEDISYLYTQPIFDNTHVLVNQYANGWTIDPEYIKQNYHSGYYKKIRMDQSILK